MLFDLFPFSPLVNFGKKERAYFVSLSNGDIKVGFSCQSQVHVWNYVYSNDMKNIFNGHDFK